MSIEDKPIGHEPNYLEKQRISGYPVFARELPDYPNDLNAMHEAEKVLTGRDSEEYALMLSRVCDGQRPDAYKHWSDIAGGTTSATAAQRCEAFLRTIGKWDETK